MVLVGILYRGSSTFYQLLKTWFKYTMFLHVKKFVMASVMALWQWFQDVHVSSTAFSKAFLVEGCDDVRDATFLLGPTLFFGKHSNLIW